jgi:hypothetical protein
MITGCANDENAPLTPMGAEASSTQLLVSSSQKLSALACCGATWLAMSASGTNAVVVVVPRADALDGAGARPSLGLRRGRPPPGERGPAGRAGDRHSARSAWVAISASLAVTDPGREGGRRGQQADHTSVVAWGP